MFSPFSGRNLEKFPVGTGESQECYEQSSMSSSSGSSEAQNTVRNTDRTWYSQVPDGNKDCIGNWTGGHSFHNQAENVSIFCLFPKILNESELESNVLKNSVEEIQDNTLSWSMLDDGYLYPEL